MNLQQLATDLRGAVKDGKLTLDNTIVKQNSLAFVLSYFDGKKIALAGLTNPPTQITVSGSTLTITGTQTLYGLSQPVQIALLQTDANTLQSTYTTAFTNLNFSMLAKWNIIPAGYFDLSLLPKLPFQAVTMAVTSEVGYQQWAATTSANEWALVPAISLKIKNIGFGIQRAPNALAGGYDTSFWLTGTFLLGKKTNLTVTAAVPVSASTPAGQWLLNLSSTATLADGIADLSQLVFGNNLFATLPPGFQQATSFSLDQLLLAFSLDGGGTVKYAKIMVSRPADQPWTIVDGFTVTGAGANFTLNKATTRYTVATYLFAKFAIGGGSGLPAKAYLNVSLDVPAGISDWVASISGSLENTNGIGDLFSSLPASNGYSLPAFPVGLKLQEINLQELTIAFNPTSKTLAFINLNVSSILEFDVFGLLLIRNSYVALSIKNPALSQQRTLTGVIGGNLEIGGVSVDVMANKPTADEGWTFFAGMQPSTVIPLLDLVKKFLKPLGVETLPDWVNKASLNISGVAISIYVPTATSLDQSKKYHVEGTVKWKIDVNSFALPTALNATVSLDYANGKASGTITVVATLLLLPFKLGYKFGTPATEVYLEWLGIQADYKHNGTTMVDVITITFANMSVGEILTHLIQSFDPSFALSPPWDVLNSINLNGLSLKYTNDKNTSDNSKIEIVYAKSINLGFLQINQLTITKDKTGVFLGFKGKFLGAEISSTSPDPNAQKLAGKGSDVRELGSIPVPGMGTQFFDLDYLGLGQRVALYPFEDLKTVDQAIDRLKGVFLKPPTPAPGKPPILPIKATPKTPPATPTLVFNEESSWLIATKFTIIEAITLGIVFNDPNLYGLLVKVDSEKMKALNKLSFQILYKKVTDSVGVYQIELKLPDSVRELQFGAVSVTLPVISIDVYTNGSFRLDFGFPANLDFSRSLTIQAFPFTGSGGFYIAYLQDVPSDKVPKTTRGIFNPILEFGLGLQLGIGKSINKGILKAGFSVTVIGLFEGVLAFFKTPAGLEDTYYKVSATVGLVGRLYGEINFAIISASVDVTVYAYVQMVVEAYRKIPIYLEAGVSVSLQVSVNLGLFKINISLRFSTTISASFTIGSDSTAPWDLPATNQRRLLRLEATPALVLTWNPLVLTAQEQAQERLSLYFFPQLTVASDSTAKAVQFCNLLYIDAPENGSTTDASLNRLVKGVLYWCINAAINSGKSGVTLDALQQETTTVSYDVLKQLHAYLSDTSSNPSPIPYANIEAFLKAYFTISIADTDEAAARNVGTGEPLHASIFPIFPMLQVGWELNGTSHDLTTCVVDSAYMAAVQDALRKLRVDYQNPAEKAQDKMQETGHGVRNAAPRLTSGQALSTFIFQDYILMLARAAVQDAISELEKFAAPFGSKDSLYTIAATYNALTYTHGDNIDTNEVTVAGLAAANSGLLFRKELLLEISAVSYQVRAGDTLQRIAAQYRVDLAAFATGGTTAIQGLVAAGTVVKVAGFDDYQVGVGQTLDQVAASMTSASGAHPTIEQVLQAVKDLPLLSLAKLALPTLAHKTGEADSFESVAVLYGVSIATLASNERNAKAEGLFNDRVTTIALPSLQVLGVKTVVNTFDTSDNIARISGMAARFFLHGMRLPVPGQLASTAPLYKLSGQQFSIPALKKGDALSIQLRKVDDEAEPCFIKLNGSCATPSLTIPITDVVVSRIQSLEAAPFDPGAAPLPLPLGKQTSQTFTLKPGINWQYPGSLALPAGTPPAQLAMRPSVWVFSEALINKLEALQATNLELRVQKMVRQSEQGDFDRQPVYNGFATLLNFSIQQVQGVANAEAAANVYEVIGAGDTSIVLLERLIRYINKHNGDDSFIDQIRILYPADPTGDAPVGLQSAADGGAVIALVQANLSTETNPSGPMFFRSQENAPRNTLNEFKQFISLLWQCSIVRTGGYFLYYKTTDGAGLPSSLFSQGKTAKIQLLVTYKKNLSAAFVNSVAIGEPIDAATTTVYVEAPQLNMFVAVASPGTAGFELERTKPTEYVPVNPYPIPADAASKQQDLNYLNYQFNLIGYALLETDVFNGAYSLLPVGPTHSPAADGIPRLAALPDRSLTDENWKYNTLIPLAKSVKNNKRIQPAKETYPAAANDPYAGIGSTAQVRLNWQDLFGNTFATPLSDGKHDLPLSFLYTDPLFALAQWPSVSSYYYFGTKAGTPQLHIDFFASAARYTVSSKLTKEEAINNARIDQVTIQKIYYQLIQEGVVIQVQSSLNAEAEQPAFSLEAKVLAGYAGELYAYLSAVIADPLAASLPAPVQIAYDIDLKNSNLIFELTVVLSVQRPTKYIDPSFVDVAEVGTVVNVLSPVLKAPATAGANDPSEDILSLAVFAKNFEAAFQNRPAAGNFLKVATGLNRHSIDSMDDKKLWVVHFDANGQAGIWYTIDNTQQYFFAPKPLANNLETFDKVPIYGYKTGEAYPFGSSALTTFSDIDLDNWGRLCLDAIDLLLTATYATPAFLVDNGVTLQKILAAKEQIAEGIAASVAPIIQAELPDLSGLATAQEKLKQQVLVQLSNAYKISTVVQNAVHVKKGFAGPNVPGQQPPFVPQLYGNVVSVLQEAVRSRHTRSEGAGEPADDYTLSTAKVPLGTGISWLTYLFEAKEADKHSSFNFADMAFQVSYIEHQIDTVENMGNYRASSWLTLLLPLNLTMSDIGPVNIPVALRSYPTPPSLVSQEIDYPAASSTAPAITIPEALQWGYAFSYQPPLAGQDQIHAVLQFNYNNQPDQANALFYQEDGSYDDSLLPATLAQFVTVYPAIQKDFQEILLRNPAAPAAAIALNAFCTLITHIGTAWKQWEKVKVQSQALRQSNPLPTYIYKYDVIEAPEAGGTADPKLTITVKPRDGAPELTVSLLDYLPGPNNTFYKKVGTTEQYLRYSNRKSVPLRTLSLGQRNILAMQNAWSGVLLTRNEDLVKDKEGAYRTTEPAFIYKTPLVKFYNELVPLLVCGKPIEVAQIETPGKPKVLNLAKHLQNLFKTLLTTPDKNVLAQTIKVECQYTYNLTGTDAFNQITLPVLLVTPMVFTLGKDWDIGPPGAYCADTDSFVCNLTQVILNWFEINNPLINSGKLQFIIEVYSESNNKLPILKLSDVLLQVPYIEELAKTASLPNDGREPSS